MKRSLAWTLLMLWAVPTVAQASDWAQWRGPDRNGISSEKGWSADWPKEGPKILWSCKATGMGCSSMAVSANRVYTMGNLQLGTKEVEVTEKKKEKNAEGKETVTEVKTMKTVAQAEDTAFCVDGETGAVIWKRGGIL